MKKNSTALLKKSPKKFELWTDQPVRVLTDASKDWSLTEDENLYVKKLNAFLGVDQKAVWVHQMHGSDVILVDSMSCICGLEADAMVTQDKKVVLTIRTADCLPIFFFDPFNEAFGLAHAGWRSTHQEIALRTLENVF